MLFQAAQAANQAAQQAAQLELAGGQPTNTNALAIRRPFDPRAHDLDAHFRLTRFADLKGWGCKVPQDVLLKLLEGLQDDANSQEEHHFMHMAIPRIGEFIIFMLVFLKNNSFLWDFDFYSLFETRLTHNFICISIPKNKKKYLWSNVIISTIFLYGKVM